MKKLKFYEISRIFRKFSLKSSLVSKPSVDCRLLGILEVIFTHFHFFALFAPKSLFRSKITFSLQNHFFAQKSLFRSKITFSLKNQLFAPSAPLVSKPSVDCRFFGHLEVIFPLGVIFSEI